MSSLHTSNRNVRSLGLLLAAASMLMASGAPAEAPSAQPAPSYKVDPEWPKHLPNKWIMGQVAGVSVDTNDHVWIVQRPESLTDDEKAAALVPPRAKCCLPAPEVIELDRDGTVVRAWGKPADGSPWFTSAHAIHVDSNGYVWLTGNGKEDGSLLKYTKDGKFVMRIGRDVAGGDSADVARLGGAAGIHVDVAAKEVYVSDGYRNRRVIVFDTETGAYKRHWGAYGKPPIDPTAGAELNPLATFNRVHCVTMSNTGEVYVCDRGNNRVQVFRKDGTFIREMFFERETRGMGSVWALAFVPGGAANLLIGVDGVNNEIRLINAESGAVTGRFGSNGRMAGQFHWAHAVAADTKGNLYVGEVDTGKRLQKFEKHP